MLVRIFFEEILYSWRNLESVTCNENWGPWWYQFLELIDYPSLLLLIWKWILIYIEMLVFGIPRNINKLWQFKKPVNCCLTLYAIILNNYDSECLPLKYPLDHNYFNNYLIWWILKQMLIEFNKVCLVHAKYCLFISQTVTNIA